MSDRATVSALSGRLRHTWRPFFGRFGGLTPVQIAATPPILDGKNVVVMAPTASGKTEAVVAPVAERHMQERWDGLAVLYIVPTRALANDTLKRVAGPLEDMGLRAVLKHGDHSHLPTRLDWLITTPESLDSLICRHPDIFAQLRAVLLDEIHLLDGTYRGDQLRVLLTRLRELTAHDFAVHLISATLPNADAVAQRYIPSAYELVSASGGRAVDLQIVTSHEEINQLARQRGWKKILYFCNKREAVETVASELATIWKPYPVVAHHGALTKRMREEAEQVLNESARAVGVATSTLEVGIDIGDIDLVVLAELPWSVAALMQRVGRGCRRSGRIQCAALITTPHDHIVIEAMFAAVAEGRLEVSPYTPDLSVGVQQALSIVFQHRGPGASDTHIKQMLARLMPPEITEAILMHLQERGWLDHRGSRWYSTKTLIDEAERGDIHANIPDTKSHRVIDVETSNDIGQIAGIFDDVFLLNGQAWQVIDMSPTTVRVRRFRGKANAAIFKRHIQAGRYFRLLPMALKALMRTSDNS